MLTFYDEITTQISSIRLLWESTHSINTCTYHEAECIFLRCAASTGRVGGGSIFTGSDKILPQLSLIFVSETLRLLEYSFLQVHNYIAS